MKITCHSCSAKYTVSDDKVQGKTVKMKCRKCGSTIVVGASSGADAAADVGASAEAGMAMEGGDGPPPGSFLVSVADGDQRTMTLAEVVEAYNGGVITADTYVWAEGMNDWQALSDNQEICGALNEAASGASSAMSSGGYGGSSGFASSPPAAAPVAAKKDNARRSQDLFAPPPDSYSGGASFGASSGALAPSGSVGKRDENSVLFSLNALTAATAAPAKTTATKEDSGLIDLKALAAAAPSAAQEPSADAAFLMAPVIAPIPQPQPQMNYAAPVAVETKRSPLPIVVGGVVALAAIVAVFMLVRGDDKKTEPTANAATEKTAAPTATAAPTTVAAAPTTTATTTTEASAEPSASMSGQPVAVGPKPTGKVPTATTKPNTTATAKTTTTTTATTKPTAAKGNCGCPAGNLDCMLKCSVGKK